MEAPNAGREDSGSGPQSRENVTTLMTVPIELRRLIFAYFLKMRTDVEVPNCSDTAKIDMSLLHVCQQLRDESWTYLLNTNFWTRMTSDHNTAELRTELGSLLYMDINIFSQHEREKLRSQAVLHIHMGDSYPRPADYAPTEHQYDFLVVYSPSFRFRLPKILISPSMVHYLKRVVDVTVNITDRNQGMLEELLLSLTTVRDRPGVFMTRVIGGQPPALAIAVKDTMNGKNTDFAHFYNHMLALQEESEKFYSQGYLKGAVAYCLDGIRLYESYRSGSWPFKEQLSQAQSQLIDFLAIDMVSHFGMACHLIVAQSREDTGHLSLEAINPITIAIDMRQSVFIRPDITDIQRTEAHYRNAIALQLLAEYLSMPGYREYMLETVDPSFLPALDRNREDLLEEATANYFYAWQVDVNSPVAEMMQKKYQELSYSTGFYMCEDPELATVDGAWWTPDGSWTGDPVLVETWTVEGMKSWPLIEKVTENYARTEKELRKMQEKLGMQVKQQGGLLRLLGLGGAAVDEQVESVVDLSAVAGSTEEGSVGEASTEEKV